MFDLQGEINGLAPAGFPFWSELNGRYAHFTRFMLSVTSTSLVKIHYPDPVHYRKPLPEERVAELTTVDWFSAVASPERVATAALSYTWEDFRLERRNDLTAVVAVRLQQRGSEWNKCAKAFTNFFDSYIAPTINKRLSEIGLPDSLLDIVAWDIVSYMQELNYSDVRRPDFFGKIWTAYKQGYFPCGWEGDYPVGALITP